MSVYSTCHPDKQHRARGLCSSCYATDWQRRNPERNRANRDREKARRTAPMRKAAHLRFLYGLSLEEYEQRLADQGGRCAVCRGLPGQRALAVDHDHQTGRIRGLLCARCNRGVGAFLDNPEFMRQAAAYLEAVG